ncbi:imidazolonepropionase [Lewinellaceae bacterium SD302]|nr:imidazolonepropionase [Lewinellaceae bacterium SD302]
MKKQLTGPFAQLLTMSDLPERGALKDEQLAIISNAGILSTDGRVVEVGDFENLRTNHAGNDLHVQEISVPMVAMPGFVDAHTHLLYGGSRARDFALRNAGSSYLEIAEAGGGIKDSVRATRAASDEELITSTLTRLDALARLGTTTCEIKTGYGLSVTEELRMIKAINEVKRQSRVGVIPTCLAAHVVPPGYQGSNADYLTELREKLLANIIPYTNRIDIFIEESTFPVAVARPYLAAARSMGFQLAVHADQFTTGGSALAVELGAASADHLEASGEAEIALLAQSDTVAVALPGASLGLGMQFTPARKLLDAGACLAIASDFNPGSAPMGDLLTQASILATYEKLSNAEVLAGITVRAARALRKKELGYLAAGTKADFIGFATNDYREITYQQGRLRPAKTWIDGTEY